MSSTQSLPTFTWIENWAQLPADPAHSHHGLVITKADTIISSQASDNTIIVMDQDGQVIRRFPSPTTLNHCLAIAEIDGEEILLIADCEAGRVISCTMEGIVLRSLTAADLPGFEHDDIKFACTAVSWDPQDGSIWIADGYGSHRVFKLNSNWEVELVLDGSSGAGTFKQPHWVYVDSRAGESAIYIADRQNNRVQVYQPDGTFIKSFGEGFMNQPSAFTTYGDQLIVAELCARLVVCDHNDDIIGTIGDGSDELSRPGWPNRLNEQHEPVAPHSVIPEEVFNSPHGIDCDSHGNIYVTEWLFGDRWIKLVRTH